MYKLEVSSYEADENNHFIKIAGLTVNPYDYEVGSILDMERSPLIRNKSLESLVDYPVKLYVYSCGENYYGSKRALKTSHWNKKLA